MGSNDVLRVLRLVFWETTARCNLHCVHCRRLDVNAEVQGELTTDEGRRLMDDISAIGAGQGFVPIVVFSGGEPLCREDIFDLAEYAKGCGLHTALATNGTLLDAMMVEKVKAAGFSRVSISLDGASAEVHNRLRNEQGSFEAAMAGARRLREAAVEFQINMTVTRATAGDIDAVFALAEEIGAAAVHLFVLVPVGCGRELEEGQMLSGEELERVLMRLAEKERAGVRLKVTCCPSYQRIRKARGQRGEALRGVSGSEGTDSFVPRNIFDEARGTRHEALRGVSGSEGTDSFVPRNIFDEARGQRGEALRGGADSCLCRNDKEESRDDIRAVRVPMRGCLAGSGIVFVSHKGEVFPCGYLPVRCGNVLEETLSQIWQKSPVLNELARLDGLKGKCGVCEYRKICGGCRARAYAVSGDYMESEPSCSYVPKGWKE